ncbi:MAG: hypothetical protein D6767_04900 [Candidatus Hydrogenedentota bacterium]|nr:MAG: hypothetical protein D6767_04900 [Candidatus Hydrogenedentota bacterium]
MDRQYTILAPAKLNLGLRILGKSNEGWHYLASPILAIPFYDILEGEIFYGKKRSCEVKIHYPDDIQTKLGTSLQKDITNNNLIWKVLDKWLLFANTKQEYKVFAEKGVGAHLALTKKIPSPSGFGGGSSDMAAFLEMLANFVQVETGISKTKFFKDILAISETWSGDLPFFIEQKINPDSICMICGKGKVHPILDKPKKIYGILGFADFGFSTKEMFKACSNVLDFALQAEKDSQFGNSVNSMQDLARSICEREKQRFLAQWQKQEAVNIMQNDFLTVAHALYKDKADALEQALLLLQQELASLRVFAMIGMSGSGPGLYAVFREAGFLKDLVLSMNRKTDFRWIAFPA